MINLTRISETLRAVRLTWSIRRSGIFSVEKYRRANPDIHLSDSLAIFHYCRHGQFEQRTHGQPAITAWLLQSLLSSRAISARAAKSAWTNYHTAPNNARALCDLERFAERQGLSVDLLLFFLSEEQHDFRLAAQHLESVPIALAFPNIYKYARRHFLTKRLPEAYSFAVEQLRLSAFERVEDLIAAHDIASYLNHPAMSKQTFAQLLLANLCKLETARPADRFRQLWQAGLPIFADGSEAAERLLDLLPQRVGEDLRNATDEWPISSRSWVTFFNAQSLNLLLDEQFGVSADGMLKTLTPEASAETITLRMLGEGYWRLGDEPGLFASIIEATQTLLKTAYAEFKYVFPDLGTQIFDSRLRAKSDHPTISYHTISTADQASLNYKESALPGYFSFDSHGYSGWADAPKKIDLSTNQSDIVDHFFEVLNTEFVMPKKTKYESDVDNPNLPPNPFVLIALQVPDDTVAQLTRLPPSRLVETVSEHYHETGIDVVIKCHPHDRSINTKRLIDDVCTRYPHVQQTRGSIHSVLASAGLVVTANSGVGFEALLHEKRVITTGESEYGRVTTHVQDEGALKHALMQFTSFELEQEQKSKIRQFVYTYLNQHCFKSDTATDPLRFYVQGLKKK